MFPPPTFGTTRNAASPSMGLFPRASRNTFSNRVSTGEIRILAAGRPPRCRSCTRKESRGYHRARPHGSRRLHRLFCDLHRVQHAAGAGYLHRGRGAAPQESQPFARTSRGTSLRRMGAARFRRFCRARFQRAGPALLRSRAPLAHGPQARYPRPARRSCFRTKHAGFAFRARTLFRRSRFQPAAERSLAAMTAERLPWISSDPASLRLFELAEKVAVAPATLLITGESGTGKDHLARLVHELGPRRDAPFLKIDCASLPPQLVESELFGHERGAFTGAVERKLGRFELGGNGTIVLDEVAALSPGAQGKLLRILQERTFERLGGNETLHIEARLIALTNVDLPAAVKSGGFREDLFFRLNVLMLTVPPLRERRADILLLAEHLLVTLRVIHGRARVQLSDASRRMLTAYSWPCNIRELRNALERAVVFSRPSRGTAVAKNDFLEPKNFPESVRAAASGAASPVAGLRSLEEVEREVIAATLEATHYQISRSAEALGISRKTLLEKRKKYGLK